MVSGRFYDIQEEKTTTGRNEKCPSWFAKIPKSVNEKSCLTTKRNVVERTQRQILAGEKGFDSKVKTNKTTTYNVGHESLARQTYLSTSSRGHRREQLRRHR